MTAQIHPHEKSLWSRILDWSRALDDALDHNPGEESVKHLTRNVAALENRIRELEHKAEAKRP